MKISERWTMKINLQYFHLQASHPPKIGVEYYNVNTFPILAMLIDWTFSNNPIRYSMNDSIVWVWFKKKRCPVELNCGIVFLIQHIRSITRNRKHKYKAKIRNISKCLFEFKCVLPLQWTLWVNQRFPLIFHHQEWVYGEGIQKRHIDRD